MKRLLFFTCASLAGHAVIEVDGVFYNTYWVGSHQEAMVVVGDTYDQDKEINYTGLVHANIRDSVSFDGTTISIPIIASGFKWRTFTPLAKGAICLLIPPKRIAQYKNDFDNSKGSILIKSIENVAGSSKSGISATCPTKRLSCVMSVTPIIKSPTSSDCSCL